MPTRKVKGGYRWGSTGIIHFSTCWCKRERYANLTSAELLAAIGTDASKWADAFLEISKKVPTVPSDRLTMVGWFANAIMAGYDWRDRENREAHTSVDPNDDPTVPG
jgi:hypothetical protein